MHDLSKLHDLEKSLLNQTRSTIEEVKFKDETRLNLAFNGVYAIWDKDEIIKIGKTSNIELNQRKEAALADRIWGHTDSNSRLRDWVIKYYNVPTASALQIIHNFTITAVQIDNPLERGRFEYYMISKYIPLVNHDELKK